MHSVNRRIIAALFGFALCFSHEGEGKTHASPKVLIFIVRLVQLGLRGTTMTSSLELFQSFLLGKL